VMRQLGRVPQLPVHIVLLSFAVGENDEAPAVAKYGVIRTE
jgi:hypothetical protein